MRFVPGNLPIRKLAKANGNRWDGIVNVLRSESTKSTTFWHQSYQRNIDERFMSNDFMRNNQSTYQGGQTNDRWFIHVLNDSVQFKCRIETTRHKTLNRFNKNVHFIRMMTFSINMMKFENVSLSARKKNPIERFIQPNKQTVTKVQHSLYTTTTT